MELHDELVEQHDLRRRATATSLIFTATYIPRRDPKFDWTKPVDGSDPATDWQGLAFGGRDAEAVRTRQAAGFTTATTRRGQRRARAVRRQSDYPKYVDNGSRISPRPARCHASCENKKDFTLEGLAIAAAYDSYLTWFEKPIPALIKAWDAAPSTRSSKSKTGRADRRSCANGISVGASIPCRRRWRFTGARSIQRRAWRRRRERAGMSDRTNMLQQGLGRAAAVVACRSIGPTRGRLWHMENAVGRDQSFSAAHRRHRSSVH